MKVLGLVRFFVVMSMGLATFGCGDRAGYELLDEEQGVKAVDADAIGVEGLNQDPDNGDLQGETLPGGEDVTEAGDNESTAADVTGTSNGTSNETEIVYDTPLEEDCAGDQECIDEGHEILGTSESESEALNACLSKWGDTEFGKKIGYVREIHALTSIGGHGVLLNDWEPTAEPELVLVHASVNVGGDVTYKLQNPNGYYCIMVDVNVCQDLTIDLHCDAHLADTNVSVNVGSDVEQHTANVSVAIHSDIDVKVQMPDGGHCD